MDMNVGVDDGVVVGTEASVGVRTGFAVVGVGVG